MDWDHVEGRWDSVKGQVQGQWRKLTQDDIDGVGGKRDQLIDRLQQRYAMTQEEAEREVDLWAGKLKAQMEHSHLLSEIERLKEEVSRLMGSAGDTVRDKSKDAAEQASALGKELEAAIERNPMQAVLIAAGIGLVLGWLTRSNS